MCGLVGSLEEWRGDAPSTPQTPQTPQTPHTCRPDRLREHDLCRAWRREGDFSKGLGQVFGGLGEGPEHSQDSEDSEHSRQNRGAVAAYSARRLAALISS